MNKNNLFIKDFKGNCLGIRLKKRHDNHICFSIIKENRFKKWTELNNKDIFTSYWTIDLLIQILEAEKWMKNNCEANVFEGNKLQFGFNLNE